MKKANRYHAVSYRGASSADTIYDCIAKRKLADRGMVKGCVVYSSPKTENANSIPKILISELTFIKAIHYSEAQP